MPTATFNIGKDGQIVLVGPRGRLDLNYTEFQAQQRTHQVTSRPLGKPTQVSDLPDLWSGSFQVDRNSSNLEDEISQNEQGFWAGGAPSLYTMYQYTKELDGSTSTYQFSGVTIRLSNAGTYRQDDTVKQTVEFSASTRQRI